MMTRMDEIRQLFEFDRWANQLILDAAATIAPADFTRDLGSSFPSLRDTLVHVIGADWVWLRRLEGETPPRPPAEWAASDLEQLRGLYADVQGKWSTYLESMEDAQLDEVLEYRYMSGEAASSTRGQILRHVVNHSTYHRGQAVTMLRQLGATPPRTDLIHYYRSVAPPPLAG